MYINEIGAIKIVSLNFIGIINSIGVKMMSVGDDVRLKKLLLERMERIIR